jgi:hypothetical protein
VRINVVDSEIDFPRNAAMQRATVRTLVAAAAGGLVGCGGSAGASSIACDLVSGNLVQNCGFEHGFTHWNSNFQGAGGFVNPLAAYNGIAGLLFLGSPPLYRTLTTARPSPGLRDGGRAGTDNHGDSRVRHAISNVA